MFIYKITNTVNGKVYIGQTVRTMEVRRNEHLSDLRNNKHCNLHFQSSFNKYGETSFKFEILEDLILCPLVVDYRERYYIKLYSSMDKKNGYNLHSGGNLNKRASEETKLKMKIAKSNIPQSVRDKISKALKGRTVPQHVVDSIKKANIGKKHTEETKRLWSIGKKKDLKNSEFIRQQGLKMSKPIIATNMKTGESKEFCSMNEASRQLSIRVEDIVGVCKGRHKYAIGFFFKYKELTHD